MRRAAEEIPVPAFHRRTVRWLIGAVAVSLAIAGLMVVFGYDFEFHRSSMNDSYSTSALGHRGFRGLLHRLGLPVMSSRNRTSRRAADRGVLIVAEPQSPGGLRSMLLTADAAIVVLPKRQGHEDPRRPGWLDSVSTKPQADVESVLDALLEDADALSVVRATVPLTGWHSTIPQPVGAPPDCPNPQLIAGDALESIIGCDQGVLFGALKVPGAAGPIYVLADPDLIANHGLTRGRNALTAVRIVEFARRLRGPVVFEETVHGHSAHPSILRDLFRYPLVLATLQVALVGTVVLWLAMVRFGAPLHAPARFGAGKRYLIEHLATVQRLNGHTPAALRRYFRSTRLLVARRLNIPDSVQGSEFTHRIAQCESARGPSQSLDDVRNAVALASAGDGGSARLTAAARAVHTWREEMLRGS